MYLSWTLNQGPWWGKIGPVLTIGEDIQQILLIGLRVVQIRSSYWYFLPFEMAILITTKIWFFGRDLTIAPVIIIIISRSVPHPVQHRSSDQIFGFYYLVVSRRMGVYSMTGSAEQFWKLGFYLIFLDICKYFLNRERKSDHISVISS